VAIKTATKPPPELTLCNRLTSSDCARVSGGCKFDSCGG
jgi:hypothetical protein